MKRYSCEKIGLETAEKQYLPQNTDAESYLENKSLPEIVRKDEVVVNFLCWIKICCDLTKVSSHNRDRNTFM